jgi:hypothetical protein
LVYVPNPGHIRIERYWGGSLKIASDLKLDDIPLIQGSTESEGIIGFLVGDYLIHRSHSRTGNDRDRSPGKGTIETNLE